MIRSGPLKVSEARLGYTIIVLGNPPRWSASGKSFLEFERTSYRSAPDELIG